MARLRFTFATTAAFIALAAFALNSTAQQAQGPGGNGGFGGGRGSADGRGVEEAARRVRFRRLRWAFGGSALGLASNPAIQVELKATDKQKAQIKSLSESSTSRCKSSAQRWVSAADQAVVRTATAQVAVRTHKSAVDVEARMVGGNGGGQGQGGFNGGGGQGGINGGGQRRRV